MIMELYCDDLNCTLIKKMDIKVWIMNHVCIQWRWYMIIVVNCLQCLVKNNLSLVNGKFHSSVTSVIACFLHKNSCLLLFHPNVSSHIIGKVIVCRTLVITPPVWNFNCIINIYLFEQTNNHFLEQIQNNHQASPEIVVPLNLHLECIAHPKF